MLFFFLLYPCSEDVGHVALRPRVANFGKAAWLIAGYSFKKVENRECAFAYYTRAKAASALSFCFRAPQNPAQAAWRIAGKSFKKAEKRGCAVANYTRAGREWL